MIDYERTDCIKSYFEIVALVNKGNRVINEQTEAKFFMKVNSLFLGVNDDQKYLLCTYNRQRWFPYGDDHERLKEFVAEVINQGKVDDINTIIKTALFKLGD